VVELCLYLTFSLDECVHSSHVSPLFLSELN
jgi:hypothetical protein